MYFKKINSIIAVVKRNFILLLREKQLIIAPIMLPLVLMFLTSIIMGAGGDRWPVGVVNQSASTEAQQLVTSIQDSHSNITPYFNIVEKDLQEASKAVREGRLQMMVRIPKDFGENKTVYMQTFNINSDMMKNVRLRLKHAVNKYLKRNKELKIIPKLRTEKKEDVWRVSFISGSCVLLALFFGATIVAANLFAYERENRTAKEILLGPLGSFIAGVGNIITAVLFSIIASLPALLLAVTIFKLEIYWGHLLLVYLSMIPIQIGFAGLGIYIAQLLKRYQVIQPIIIVTSVATFFGGGGFAGVEMLPPLARGFAKIWIFSRVFEWFNPVLHKFQTNLSMQQYFVILTVGIIGISLVKYTYNKEENQYIFSGQ